MVLIHPLEGVVVKARCKECSVLTSGFTIIELDLIPGEKPGIAVKTQNIASADIIPLCYVCVAVNREQ